MDGCVFSVCVEPLEMAKWFSLPWSRCAFGFENLPNSPFSAGDLVSLLLTVVDTGVSSLVHGLMDRVDSTASWMVYLKPSVKSEGRCAGGGGVIRNCEGRWQCGFSVHLGQCLVP